MEKKLTLSNIRANFKKDFDTIGKMVTPLLSRTPIFSLKLARVSSRQKSQKVYWWINAGGGK